MKMPYNYFLFSDDIYDDIKMVYTKNQMEKFFALWQDNKKAQEIAKEMRVSEIEIFLLITDLLITENLPKRDTDYYGRVLKK